MRFRENMFHRLMFLGLITLAFSACSREASLYPANLEAGPAALKAKFTDSGMGKGPVELTLPSGEVMRGEFGTTDTANYGFGTAVASAGGRAAVATASSTAIPGSMPGVVTMIGDRGTRGECGYQVNTWSSSGTGVCKFSNGAVYNMHF